MELALSGGGVSKQKLPTIRFMSGNDAGLVLEYKIIGSLSRNMCSAWYILVGIGI